MQLFPRAQNSWSVRILKVGEFPPKKITLGANSLIEFGAKSLIAFWANSLRLYRAWNMKNRINQLRHEIVFCLLRCWFFLFGQNCPEWPYEVALPWTKMPRLTRLEICLFVCSLLKSCVFLMSTRVEMLLICILLVREGSCSSQPILANWNRRTEYRAKVGKQHKREK